MQKQEKATLNHYTSFHIRQGNSEIIDKSELCRIINDDVTRGNVDYYDLIRTHMKSYSYRPSPFENILRYIPFFVDFSMHWLVIVIPTD